MKKYQIIYADPPWSYRDKALAGKRGACCKYNTMTHNELLTLPLSEIAADNCVLFLWVTAPKLNEVFEYIRAWGFQYKTRAFTWVKKNKRSNTLFWGMGSWTRANTEDVLLATKGNPKRISAGVHSVIEAPIREHSRKPDEVRDRIIQLVGDLPRIELFAREKKEGWTSIGYDINGKDIKQELEEMINA